MVIIGKQIDASKKYYGDYDDCVVFTREFNDVLEKILSTIDEKEFFNHYDLRLLLSPKKRLELYLEMWQASNEKNNLEMEYVSVLNDIETYVINRNIDIIPKEFYESKKSRMKFKLDLSILFIVHILNKGCNDEALIIELSESLKELKDPPN